MAYRSTFQESTGCTPNRMMLGREISVPLDLIVGNPPDSENSLCPVEYVEWLRHSLGTAFEFANANLQRSATRQKRYHDRNLKQRQFEPGDFVWRWYPPTANIKLGLGWTGPFKVIRRLSDMTLQIQRLPDSLPITVHVDHLKPYTGNLPPNSWDTDLLEISHEQTDQNLDLSQLQSPDLSVDHDDSVSQGDEVQNGTPPRTRCGRQIRKPVVYSP